VNASFSTLVARPLEMLYHVCDVYKLAVNSCLFKSAVQKHAGRPDKRSTDKVLAVSRLFADEHNARPASSLPENGLRARLP
jgi:hypothetical protein